jgi:two-component system NarL family sensor kinase
MTRGRRIAAIAAAWAVPVAWIAVALFSGPSDGTTVAPPAALLAAAPDPNPRVVRSYGGSPLLEGDLIRTVDGRPVAEWLSGPGPSALRTGHTLTYEVRRAARGLDQDLTIDVALGRYPLLSALAHNVATDVLVLALLVAGSAAFWSGPSDPTIRAVLVASSLLPAAVTSHPLGPDLVDLAGRPWVALGGELLTVVGMSATLVAGLSFADRHDWRRRHRTACVAIVALPAVGYAVGVVAATLRGTSGPARLLAVLAVGLPAAALATLAGLVAVLVLGYTHAATREDRLALRLPLLTFAGAAGAAAFLHELPRRLTGSPLASWDVLIVVLAPTAAAGLVIALLRFRLEDVEPAVRRALVQAAAAVVVGSLFLAVVGAVNLASENSVQAMVAGGAVALLLLPVALGLWRVIRRLVYGDREFPYRVVSELRRLDPLTTPADVLGEMLTLLARRLRLSFAEVDVVAPDGASIHTAVGESRGRQTTVELAVAGTRLGRLRLEVEPTRDPFGPGDRRLLEDVGGQVGALVQAVAINQELQRSREHLVSAREEERRRVRRDLHDGLGPSLATMALRLETARDLIGQDPALAATLVGELSEQARAEIREVRRLVDGLRPPALDQLGLVSALRQAADQHNAIATRGAEPMTWRVDAQEPLDALPAAVEVAAYRIVLEAVNNALRHSGASTCVVRLRRSGGALRVEITDNGSGVPAEGSTGIGLASMRERAEELGGSWTLEPVPGGGTAVLALLPLATAVQEVG